ncbi:MAG: DUF4920 domain-containing protein [Bacteroidota bacterium]
MKYFLISLSFVLILAGCSNDPRLKLPQTGAYGVTFSADSTLTVKQVSEALITGNEIPVMVTGTISQYCKGEGCWLTLKNDDGEDLLIEVKDKAFVLPHNIENKMATARGLAKRDTVEGKVQLRVVADGIFIQ